MFRRSAPPSIEALLLRAQALEGHSVGELAYALGAQIDANNTRTKGKVGVLIEHALGATKESGKSHDFPDLGVELKTLPIAKSGAPSESTYVCTLHLHSAKTLTWEHSWVRKKLSRVLFVLLDGVPKGQALPPVLWSERVIRKALLWQPSKLESEMLRADFEAIVGLAALGRVEELTGHLGDAMQVRPKARDGTKNVYVADEDGNQVATVARGFYLRPSFTRAVVARLQEAQHALKKAKTEMQG
jgi:DNA mismatch repair protein MutH